MVVERSGRYFSPLCMRASFNRGTFERKTCSAQHRTVRQKQWQHSCCLEKKRGLPMLLFMFCLQGSMDNSIRPTYEYKSQIINFPGQSTFSVCTRCPTQRVCVLSANSG